MYAICNAYKKKKLYIFNLILQSLVLSYFCIQNGGGEVEAVAAANPGPAQPDDPVPDVQVPDPPTFAWSRASSFGR